MDISAKTQVLSVFHLLLGSMCQTQLIFLSTYKLVITGSQEIHTNKEFMRGYWLDLLLVEKISNKIIKRAQTFFCLLKSNLSRQESDKRQETTPLSLRDGKHATGAAISPTRQILHFSLQGYATVLRHQKKLLSFK